MISDVRYRGFFRNYLFAVAAVLLFVGVMYGLQQDPFAMGDWLINYAGGFVRRGLLGECILLLSRMLHVNDIILLLLLQWTFYGVVLRLLWTMLRGMAWPLWVILIVYSPATVSFTLINPGVAYKKEVILFALLLSVALLPERFKLTGIMSWVTIPIAVFLLLMTHEGLAVFLPYLFAVYLIKQGTVRSGFLAFIPTAAAAGVACALATRHQGNVDTATRICSSIGGGTDLSVGICNGAILYLTRDLAFARAEMPEWIRYWHLSYVAPYMIVLALVPFCMGLAKLWPVRRLECIWLTVCTLLAWLGSISLFLYTRDWYRWIYIHAFCSMVVLLMIERRRQMTPGETAVSWSLPREPVRRYAAIAFVAFMTVGWQCGFAHHFPIPLELAPKFLRQQARFIHGHHWNGHGLYVAIE